MLTIKFPKLRKPLQYQEFIDADEMAAFNAYGYNAAIAGHGALRQRYVDQRDSILNSRIQKFKTNGVLKAHKTVPFGGVACDINYDINDKYHAFKMKGLQLAMEALQAHTEYYRLPNAWVEVYMDSLAQGSSGVVGWRDEAPVGPLAVLCLGYGMVETSTGGNPTIADTLCQKRQFTGSEKEFHTKMSILHELGHIFHQLRSPNHYFAMGDMGMLYQKTEGEVRTEPPLRARMTPFTNYRLVDLKAFMDDMQSWTRIIGGYCYSLNKNPNEFVAEYYAGRKGAGLKFANAAPMLETYQGLGGPDIL